jgi:hypothetical protein
MRGTGGKSRKIGGFRRFLHAPAISAICILASAISAPTVVKAFAGHNESPLVSLAARGALGSFTPASVDPRLIGQAALQSLSHGHLFRFTPAGMDNSHERSVTVAVRVAEVHGRLIASRSPQAEPVAGFASVRITPIAYNLGLARGYQSFALPTTAPIHDLARDSSELRTFSLTAAGNGTTSATSTLSATPRLSADIAMDERNAPGRTPRTLGTQGDYQVKMGGSYRLIGNLDVTAGLRYASDRERLRALTDHRQDSQAIYVGTQIRF